LIWLGASQVSQVIEIAPLGSATIALMELTTIR
jgi:hypothetical protein